MKAEINDFDDLKGHTIKALQDCHSGSPEVYITIEDGRNFRLFHESDCCESVSVNDVVGDIQDIIDSPLLIAEEVSNSDDPVPSGESHDSYTWTYYKLGTIKGTVNIRWFGSSNGYYSERVTFRQTKMIPEALNSFEDLYR